jgi:subtilisin
MKNKIILVSLLLFIVMVFACGCTQLMEGLGVPNLSGEETLQEKGNSQNGLVKVLIGFKEKPGPAQQALVQSVGGKIKYTYNLIPAIAASIPEVAIDALKKNPNITNVDLDIKVYAIDTELNDAWGVKRIGSGVVHDNGNTGAGVKVAVIDSGIDYTHLDLADNYCGGQDFANDDNDPMDDNGHGTHVAGSIAALDDNSGVVGVAPDADLYALKVLGSDGSGDYSDVIAALDWCMINNIQVTNNSYGSSGDPGSLVQQAFDNAYYNYGILHVAAAGNSGNPPGRGDNVIYPARYDSVIAVAASDNNDKRASFSSTGAAVELIAPGVSIYSTLPDGSYGTYSGTSMASPHVAGAAAVVWEANSGSSNQTVRFQLQNTAEDLGLSSNYQGYGLVRVDLAVGAEPPTISYYTVSGTVRDNVGNLLEGATVTISETGQSGTTASDGTYAITNVQEGNYNISASKDGYSSQTVNDVNVNANTTLNFILEEITGDVQKMHVSSIDMWSKSAGPNRFISTRVEVVSATDAIVSGATVYLETTLPDGSTVSASGNTITDGTVTFEIKSRQTGTYTSSVTNVEKDVWEYDSSVNVQTSESITVQ